MSGPALHIVIELEKSTGARLLSYHLGDEVRLLAELDARGTERLRREVLASLDEALLVLRGRTAEATVADILGRRAA
jgi:hypothetical protein